MMTSEAYVWCWLPGHTSPVVAGRLERSPGGGTYDFVYGRSYLAHPEAISLYTPELPLMRGRQHPPPGMTLASALRDAAPDHWGRRVILDQVLGQRGTAADVDALDELTYLLRSGSDRIGALDFQESPVEYVHRGSEASLEDLQRAVDLLHEGRPLPKPLEQALVNGTSIGGARPKALIQDPSGPGWVAKFSTQQDIRPVIGQEALALSLARRCGLRVPESRVVQSLGKDVLLVERFDRPGEGQRRQMVSGLTMLGLDEMQGRYATYPDLVRVVQSFSPTPETVGPEIFQRVAFNMAVSNTDDHARNHSAFWDGRHLELTPAYDLDPQVRSGHTATQAMAFGADGERASDFALLVRHASIYGLSEAEARNRVDQIIETITAQFAEAADEGRLTDAQRDAMWGRQILNPGCLFGYRS